jgi:L-rhamnose isomerase
LRTLAQELVRGGFLGRVHIGLDYFDASINRVAAWVIGARNMHKALLIAMTEPLALLRQCEAEGDTTGRLALTEEARSLPWGAVWDRYCEMQGVPPGEAWLEDVRRYERTVQSKRG